jgi:hypothetical protein
MPSNDNANLPQKFYMRSETQTKHRNAIDNKLTLLIALWVLDKLVMAIMFMFLH